MVYENKIKKEKEYTREELKKMSLGEIINTFSLKSRITFCIIFSAICITLLWFLR